MLREVLLAAHEQSLAQFGGSGGLRDEGLLDSALHRPLNLLVCGKPSLFASVDTQNRPVVDT